MKVQIGTISEGTLRPEDLLDAFASELECYGKVPVISTDGIADGGTPYTDEELLDIYMDGLEELCPPFVYFGTHPDDSADFGFWPDHDALEEAMYLARHTTVTYSLPVPTDEVTLEDEGVIVQISDHGNILVMDMERNELWSCV